MRAPRAVVGAVLAAGALAGCGAGAGGTTVTAVNSAATTQAAVVSTTATDLTSTTSAPALTGTGAATAGGSGTTTATTADLPGSGKPTVLLGDMNTPEQFIIGAMYQDALEAQGYRVDLSRNIGPTSVSQAAIAQGSLDIYPEYLNVYDSQVAGSTDHFHALEQALEAGRTYAQEHGERLLTPTPFSDTAGIAVLSSYARAHHLHSIADLTRVQDELTLGSPLEFSAEPDGMPALEAAYGFAPQMTTQINIGEQYDDLSFGTLQATYVQTTDAELADPGYTALVDTKHVLGFGNVVPVVSAAVLAEEGPAFSQAINLVDRLLTTKAIRGLQAEIDGAAEPATAAAEVAREFLQGYGVLPPASYSTTTSPTVTPAGTTTAVSVSSSP